MERGGVSKHYPREPREPEDEAGGYLPYRRPSTPTWIAAAAVAFAFFVLGGFIRTYSQLETLRDESRREIGELRDSVRYLQAQLHATAARVPQQRVMALPPAPRRDRSPYAYEQPQVYYAPPPEAQSQPLAMEPPRTSPLRPDSQSVPVRTSESPLAMLQDITSEPARERPRYQIGRTAPDDGGGVILSSGGGQCQVLSVSTAQKRIMVEGGRDVGLAEGMRLELVRDGRWIADLRILDVFDNQSSCEVLHATLSPRPGDTVRRPPRAQ